MEFYKGRDLNGLLPPREPYYTTHYLPSNGYLNGYRPGIPSIEHAGSHFGNKFGNYRKYCDRKMDVYEANEKTIPDCPPPDYDINVEDDIWREAEDIWKIQEEMNHKRAREYDADVDDSDSAPSVDSTGKRKSFRRLIIRFAEKTSMQGVPYINNAKLLGAKIIWSFLLLIALIALGVHLWYLFSQFYDWPKQTKVELGFSNLRFPDVTICNTNPIHKKRFEELTGVRQLKRLVSDLNPQNLVPEQFDANFDPLAEVSTAVPDIPLPASTPTVPQRSTIDPNSQQMQSTGQQTAPTTHGTAPTASAPPPAPSNGNQPSSQPTTRSQQATTQPNTQPQGTTPEANNPAQGTTTKQNTQPLQTTTKQNNQPQGTTSQPNNQPQGTTPTSRPTTQQNNNQQGSTTANSNNKEPPTTTTGKQTTPRQNGNLPPPPPGRKRRFVNELDILNLTEYKEDFDKTMMGAEDLGENEYDGQISTASEIYEVYEELFMDLPKRDRETIGHQIKDMLLSCTFNGRDCSDRLFRLHQTSDYGNCWVLNSNKFNVQNSGPSGGLSLILYLEAQEYLKGLTTGYGMRIQIHEPDTIPYPAEEGLFIPSSMETDIGLKMVLIDRISGNYGSCDDGGRFSRSYQKKYTRRACQRLCEMMTVIDNCDCFADEHEEIATSYNDSLRPCRSDREKTCETRQLRKFDTKTAGCDCPNPCSEIQYQRSLSSRQWPNDDYAFVLLQSVCANDKEVCAKLRNDIGDQRVLNNNFLKLNIYYEDLNFQNITEEPEIALAQFLSDVGGAVGLWIGLSVLSMCEIIQLLIEICDYAVHRTIKRRRREQRRASRKMHETLSSHETKSKDSDKHTKSSGDKKMHNTALWQEKHAGKNSPRSSPRFSGLDGRPAGRNSPVVDRRNNHMKDLRGYDSDHSRRGSHDNRSHSNDAGRGLRYDDDYFRRNYMMGY